MNGNLGIGKVYTTTDNKKISGKLNFELGDSFSAKIVDKKSDSNEITVRTPDGWQFTAEIEDGIKNLPDKLVKLQVVGFEDGKLILKMVNNSKEEAVDDESFTKIISENGLTSADEDILKDMLSHGITLSRENISKVKSLMDFIAKLKDDGQNEGQNFILKYAASKGIDIDSPEGQQMEKILTKFFDDLQGMSSKDLLSMIENGIDINSENIESFKAIVKEEGSINKSIKNLDNTLSKNEEMSFNYKEADIPDNKFVQSNLSSKGAKLSEAANNSESANSSKTVITNLIDKIASEKIDLKNIDIKNIISDVLEKSNIGKSDLNHAVNVLKQQDNNEILKQLDKVIQDNTQSSSRVNYEKTINSIKNIFEDAMKGNIELEDKDIENILQKVVMNDEVAASGNSEVSKNVQSIAKNLDSLTEKLNSSGSAQNFDDIKKIITDIKSMNIDKSSNVSKALNKIIDKVNNTTNINASKHELVKLLSDLKESIELDNPTSIKYQSSKVTNKIQLLNGEDVIAEMKEKFSAVKELVEKIVNSSTLKDRSEYSSIFNEIKRNINDIKVYNTISDQYYYMDMPIKFYDNNYPCKLIIKDDRKSGKKLDSTNIKIALTISTKNLGSIDSFVTVRDKKMQIEIKCLDKWQNIFESTKTKLENKINSNGYDISISISKKEEEFNLVNCREFFNDGSLNKINVMV
ncbi:hypothetical protein IAI10_20470 [Clostridium sp. 19966]|uniref:hypothetical protein n=1 Tax=Clostridium sp. 19966 TaxID=2768166 RepID=UPI0028DEF1F2|nr:hypothetical protein [Clostridium sp. 19966]MDT8719028.1 hypothetical protein [Clostridium sp. 19966]